MVILPQANGIRERHDVNASVIPRAASLMPTHDAEREKEGKSGPAGRGHAPQGLLVRVARCTPRINLDSAVKTTKFQTQTAWGEKCSEVHKS